MEISGALWAATLVYLVSSKPARDSDSKLQMITQRDTDRDTESIAEYTMSLGHRQEQVGADQKASFLLVRGAAMQAVKEESHQQSYPVVNSLSYKSGQGDKIYPL